MSLKKRGLTRIKISRCLLALETIRPIEAECSCQWPTAWHLPPKPSDQHSLLCVSLELTPDQFPGFSSHSFYILCCNWNKELWFPLLITLAFLSSAHVLTPRPRMPSSASPPLTGSTGLPAPSSSFTVLSRCVLSRPWSQLCPPWAPDGPWHFAPLHLVS